MTDPEVLAAELGDRIGALPSGSSAAAEVASRMLTLFTSGEYERDSRLPSERQLAASLGVGRSAVREALAALELLGVVTVRPGSGTYLRGGMSELLPQTLRWGMLIGERHTLELIEVRAGLEIFAARLAATRLDDGALARMDEAVRRMRASVDQLDAFVEADLAFHYELAAATGNATLVELLQIVRSLLRVWVDRAVADAEHAATATDEHERVLDAIRTGDPDRAASAMSAHMGTASARLAGLATAAE